MTKQEQDMFAVFAEVDGYNKPLIMTHLPFARLMDDVVVPYQSDNPFFIDGAFLKRDKLKKLKIMKEDKFLETTLSDLHHGLRWGDLHQQKLYGEQYHIRLEALLRESGEDVTSQVINAYDKTIRPSLKDYLPKREELIAAAFKLFIESIKALGGN